MLHISTLCLEGTVGISNFIYTTKFLTHLGICVLLIHTADTRVLQLCIPSHSEPA